MKRCHGGTICLDIREPFNKKERKKEKKDVKECLSAPPSKDSFISSNVERSPLYQCVYKLSGLSRGQTPLPRSPPP